MPVLHRPDALSGPAAGAGAFAIQAPPPAVVLDRAVQHHLIPRLIARHRRRQPGAGHSAAVVTAAEADGLARLLIAGQHGPVRRHVRGRLARGLPAPALMLDLLGPIARRLGDAWAADTCGFAEVTTGMLTVQGLLKELDTADCAPDAMAAAPGPARRALVASTPGEQHGFGAETVAVFLRRAGWEVAAPPAPTTRCALVRAVAETPFAVVGLSLSGARWLSELEATISDIRRVSCCRNVAVVVGGPVFLCDPSISGLVGADAMGVNGRHAVTLAERLSAWPYADPGGRCDDRGSRSLVAGDP
ncbi:B12-binding domain-containing protein [Caenispirillum salinarum]|uniref:cobalamin B12-binding domain-containing protein n=1 Tax=Caenispirillum salinarum TaxID=859058 RepID=UPI00384D9917